MPTKPTDTTWAAAIADTTPLGQPKPNAPKLPPKPAPTGTPTTTKQAPRHPHHWRTIPLTIISNTAQCLAGHAPHITPKTLKALGAGQYLPQDVLDLHGLHEGDAWLRLNTFLHEAARTEPFARLKHTQGGGDFWDERSASTAAYNRVGEERSAREAQKAPRSCVVLIIHGKGRGQGIHKDMGILKSQMAAMLARHPTVVAFHTALPQHGGQGATYVIVNPA